MRSLLLFLYLSLFCSSLNFAKELVPLKIGLVYSGDSFAITHALDTKRFEKQGLAVEIVNFKSALERDNALLGGHLDGANGDLIGTSLMRARSDSIRVTAQTLGDASSLRFCGLVVSDPSKYKSPQDLVGKTIAISPHTAIEYLADRLLESNGMSPGAMIHTQIPDIHLRMNMLQQKTLDAALLPEPLASMAVLQGGKILLDNRNQKLPYAHAVLVFRTKVIQEKIEALRKFHQALWEGIREINQNPQAFRQALAERCRVPDAVKEPGFLYQFTDSQAPLPALHEDVQQWLVGKKKLYKALGYPEVVDAQFISTPLEEKK